MISSLQQDASGSSLTAFDPPVTTYAGRHYHGHARSISGGSAHRDTWEASSDVPLNDRSPLTPVPSLPIDEADHRPTETPLIFIHSDPEPLIPDISYPLESSRSDALSDVTSLGPTRPQGADHAFSHALHILFPTLLDFHKKNLLRKAASIFAAPAVFLLTITLPVVVRPYVCARYGHEKGQGSNNTFASFEEDGIERTLIADEVVQEEMHELHFNKWLMAVQCFFGPLFCVAVFFSTSIWTPVSTGWTGLTSHMTFESEGSRHGQWLLLGTGLAGLLVGISVSLFAKKGDSRAWLFARCTMGFLVAVVWIMAIADEVINVLQVGALNK